MTFLFIRICQVPFSELEARTGDQTYLSDVIGVAVNQTDIIPSNTNQDPRRQIRIKDATDRTPIVTLWGKHAEKFEAESLYQQSVDHNMIVLFTGMTVSSFSGMVSFMSTPVSRWHFNPPISETEILQNSFEGRHYLVEWDVHSGIPIETSETTLSTLGCADLSEIIAKKFKLQILITRVNEPQNWWFNSCKKCFSGMKMQDGRRKCRRCTSTESTQRYKLSVDAIDTELSSEDKPITGRFMLYGDDAATVIGKDIALLLAQSKGKQNFVPPAIASTVGKKCIVTAVIRDETYDAEEEGLIMFDVKKAEMVDQSSAVQVSVSQDTLSTKDQVADTTHPPTVHHDPTSTPMKDILHETGTNEECTSETDGKKRKAKTSTSNEPTKNRSSTNNRNRPNRQITFNSEE